jgi:signal transduction histidine kinase
MIFPAKKGLTPTWVILLLIGILATLGTLQYRSTEQVSEATARDMEENLQSALFDFRHAFERELSALCQELQSGEKDSLGSDEKLDEKEIVHHLTEWRRSARHPDLIGDLYLWNGDAGTQPVVFSPSGAYRNAPWPAGFADLPTRLQALSSEPASVPSSSSPAAVKRSKPLQFGQDPRFGWMIDEQRLTLVHPVSISRLGSHTTDWIIVPLNREFLTQHLFPELDKQQFGERSGNYKVAVILDSNPRSVLFSTEQGFGSSADPAFDARLNLFGPPSMLGNALLSHGNSVVIPTFAESKYDGPRLFIDPLPQSPDAATLEVIAQHRQGSLEAAVVRLRQRNLAVSFGVLGILALTLTLVVVTSQRARNLAKMQMDFVAGVSHELRTPLTAISLAARNLEDGVVGKNGLARYGAAIKAQAAQLSELVEEILLFSETHSGHHEYKIEPIDVTLGIENTIESLAPLIDSNGFTVEHDVSPDLLLALGDNAAFSQCLQNLITNSLKYGGDKKWIGIRATLAGNNGRKEIQVSVEDRGLGIGDDELKRIFEPFYRSPDVVSAQIHGNGLGLPLTRTMVEAMKGTITVVSRPGEGSTFTIHLRPA